MAAVEKEIREREVAKLLKELEAIRAPVVEVALGMQDPARRLTYLAQGRRAK